MIRELLEDLARRRGVARLGQRGRAVAEREWTWERTAAGYDRLLAELAARAKTPLTSLTVVSEPVAVARSRPPVFVGLTTLPSRIGKLRPTVESLLGQTLRPDRVLVCVPRRSIREDREYTIPGWLQSPPAGVQLVRCEQDFGPATKLLGCLPHVPGPACLIVVDDDMVYRPFLVERLCRAQLARPDASFSFFVERIGPLRCGQGADGFSFWTPNLAGIEAFATMALQSRHLFVADDLWISLFLQNKRISIASLQHTLGGGQLVWERTHAENQLSDLQGELARPNTFRQGMRFLLGAGVLGPRVRLLYALSAVERAARLARRVLRSTRPAPVSPVTGPRR